MVGLGLLLRRADLSDDRPHAVSHRVPHHQKVTLAGNGNLTVVSSVFWGHDRGALQEGLESLHNHLLVAAVQMQAPALSDQLHGGVAPVRLER